jgi:hypothetical protein
VTKISPEVTIKNQPFTRYADEDGNIIGLYYNISLKGHFENTWKIFDFDSIANATNSDWTITQIGFNKLGISWEGGQVDVRMQAQVGYYVRYLREGLASFPTPSYTYFFIGEPSDWSSTQTITVPGTQWRQSPSSSSTSNQTTEPAVYETSQTFQSVAIAGTVIAVVVVVSGTLLVYFKKRKR